MLFTIVFYLTLVLTLAIFLSSVFYKIFHLSNRVAASSVATASFTSNPRFNLPW